MRGWAGFLAASVVFTVTLSAEFGYVAVVGVPVNRLVSNLEAALAREPKRVYVIVNLARTHMMAYALKANELQVQRDNPGNDAGPATEPLANNKMPQVKPASSAGAEREAREQLMKAIGRFEEAIAIDPSHGFARLGYAWALQQAGRPRDAIAAYRETVVRAGPADDAQPSALMGSQSVTEEAIRYLLPLLDPIADKDEIAALRQQQTRLVRNKRAITPIAVPLEDGLDARDIVDEDASVLFDLDGSGLARRWAWITPRAAWLVHAPPERREIGSGLQLFGNVTFWLFWNNGYDALAALDDDGDRSLTGAEVRDLGLWTDADMNGRSTAGEVRPLCAFNIVALSTRYRHDATHPDEIAYSPAGVTFAGGHTRPTFDVILTRR